MALKTYRIFLASSSELSYERSLVTGIVADFKTKRPDLHCDFEVVKWENFASSYEDARKQDAYNEAIKSSDVFLMLYWTKVGMYTQEEFEVAIETQKIKSKPYLFLLKKSDGTSVEDSVKQFEEKVPLGNGKFSGTFATEKELRGDIEDELNKLFKDRILELGERIPATLLSPNGPANPTVFLGREEELKEIRKRLDIGGKLLLINAEGGIGKTTLAAKYWYESFYEYKHAAWLFCDGGITQSLKKLSPNLNVDLANFETEEKQLAALKHALSKVQNDFLLVLDNANNKDDIWAFKQEFEGFHWHVLFTSRCEDIMAEQTYRIGTLPPPLAKALFIQYYNLPVNLDLEDKVEKIVHALNYHTLLVEIFAKNAAKAKGITSLDEFMDKLKEEGLFMGEDSFEISTDHTNQHQKRSQASTDDILNKLYDFSPFEENESLRKVLLNFAILPAQDFPIDFIYLLMTNGEKEEKKKLQVLLETLNNQGWLSQTQGSYRMNPLIQELSRNKNAKRLAAETEELLVRLNIFLQNDGSVFRLSSQVLQAIITLIPAIGRNLKNSPSMTMASLFFKEALFSRITANAVNEAEGLKHYSKTIEKLLAKKKDDPDLNRERALALSLWGDFYLRLGDARKAEENYSQGLIINRNLAALDEGNTRWQQDLATSLSKMGDFYLRLGDARKAEENYSEALRMRRNLAALDEGNTSWQQDLATSLSKMGDFYLRLGDARKAEENYSEDLKISRNLAALDEGNTRWQQDLATSLSKMGDFYLRLGDMDGFEKFIEAKTIHEALLEKEPENIQYLFDYALDFLRIGNVLKMAQHENARLTLQSGRDILQSLCQKVPDDVNFKEHLELVEGWLKEMENEE